MTVPTDKEIAELLTSLAPRQRLYIEHRINGLAPVAASTAAGYPKYTHHNSEGHPRVQEVLRAINLQAMRQLTVTRQDVLQGLLDAVEASATATELTMAWREIGKLIGAYEPEQKVVKVVNAEQVRNLPDDKLLELAELEDFRLPPPIEGEYEHVDE